VTENIAGNRRISAQMQNRFEFLLNFAALFLQTSAEHGTLATWKSKN
jgi:hypothetical protein